jgi:MSHA biogenesis protein MshI
MIAWGNTALRWWRRKPAVDGLVGVGLDRLGFALAHAPRSPDGAPSATEWDFVRCSQDEDRPRLLAAEVARRGLRGSGCVVVLEPESYTLQALDAPDVPEEELRSALRWAVRDQIDFDVAQAVVDCFEIPGQANRHGKRRVYAVVARPEAVRDAVRLVAGSGLELRAIDVAELALRNLLCEHARDEVGVGLVCLREDSGLIALTRQGHLYVARWIGADPSALISFEEKPAPSGSPDEGSAEAAEALLLEVQRSLDYYQHELAQRPPGVVLLSPAEVAHPALCTYLARNLDLPVEALDAAGLVRSRSPRDDFASLLALGGALRAPEAGA